MTKALRIIYIVGDGRSGSTLLESMLNNSEQVISVGESFRFWERFYKGETLCGCNLQISECNLWRQVDTHLSQTIKDYDPAKIKKIMNEVLLYKNFNNLHKFSNTLIPIAREFYRSIAAASGKSIIVDSSKSPSWGKLLSLITEFEVNYIHLERSLPFVASSWKNKVLLPEYSSRKVYMPLKSNLGILRTWIRVKVLSHKLRDVNYIFIRYEDLCHHTDQLLTRLYLFLKLDLPSVATYYYKLNHAIAGNPIRMSGTQEIIIHQLPDVKPKNLSRLEFYFFDLVHKLANWIIR